MYCHTLSCVFEAAFNPSDDTWSAIQVYRDGNVHTLCAGFETEEEAEAYALAERDDQLEANSQFGVGA